MMKTIEIFIFWNSSPPFISLSLCWLECLKLSKFIIRLWIRFDFISLGSAFWAGHFLCCFTTEGLIIFTSDKKRGILGSKEFVVCNSFYIYGMFQNILPSFSLSVESSPGSSSSNMAISSSSELTFLFISSISSSASSWIKILWKVKKYYQGITYFRAQPFQIPNFMTARSILM